MSKCPFWSTASTKINCYSECPLLEASYGEEGCVFKEHISIDKIDFKDIIDYDYELKRNISYDMDFMSE